MKKILIAALLINISILMGQEIEQTSKQNAFYTLQPITVTIGGNFILTGSFTSSRNERLDHFITLIFAKGQEVAMRGLNRPDAVKSMLKEFDKYALRDITIKRVNGEVLKVDLLKFRITGDFSNNPYLMQDDVIIFPSSDNERNFIDISGAVNKPAKFQFVEGDRLSDAILFAGGINPAFDKVEDVEISRVINYGLKEETIKTTITQNPTLQRGDRITVQYSENYKKLYKILVLGEVEKPGYVYILKDNSTLREVILKAGGFTKYSDLKRSEIIRGTDELQALKIKAIREYYERDSSGTTYPVLKSRVDEILTEENRMSRTSNLTLEELQRSFLPDLYLKMNDPRELIDFEKIFSDSSDSGNTVVHEGDVIIIPTYMNSVYVFGQVRNQGYINFETNKDWKFYINKAGGYAERAKDEEEVRIIKGTTKTWFKTTDQVKIESGDMIYVPKEIPRDFSFYLQQIGSISSIISTIVTLTYIIIQSTK